MRKRWLAMAVFSAAGVLPGFSQSDSNDAVTPEASEQIRVLERRVEELDQRIRVAERQRELEQEASASKLESTPSTSAGAEGFSIKSAKGDFQLKVGGYLHADGRFYSRDKSNQAVDTFVLRRVRPQFQGTLYKFIEFRLMPDFGEGKTVLQDAYLDIRYNPKLSIRAGKFKAPFGLERLQSATDLAFVERGLPTGLAPNRDVGIQVSGDLFSSRVSYALAALNGTPDGGSVDADTNDGKDYVGRVFTTPFQKLRTGHPLRGLGFGIAGSAGKQDGALPTYKSAGQLTFFSYGSNVTATGARTRFSPQAYYYHDAWGVLAEYVVSEQKVKRGADVANVRNVSWQVAGSYFLTGGANSYKARTPRTPFKVGGEGWGAWELAFRIEGLTVDPKVYQLSLADASKSARKAWAWGAGVNWYLNRNARIGINYEQTKFSGGAIAENRRTERVLLDRFQIVF